MSTSRYPTLHEVIPAMDLLSDKLEEMILDEDLPASIRVGVQHGIIVLDKYYALTDDSIMWKTSMCMFFYFQLIHFSQNSIVLHPKYRKQWFIRAQWNDTWVDTAVRAASKVWKRHYKTLVKEDDLVPSRSSGLANNVFASLDAPATNVNRDPFDDFINGPPSNDNPIEYWSALIAKPGATKITLMQALAQMALDFLGAPATSTDVERLFSYSGLVCAKRRHNLNAENIKISTILGNWTRGGIVPLKKVQEALNTKYGKRDVPDDEWSDTDGESEGDDILVV